VNRRRGSVTAAELILEFEGVTKSEYDAVNKAPGSIPRRVKATGHTG